MGEEERRGSGGPNRRTELLQERISQAAMELFLRKGFARTGVREIAERSGVSVGTIFNYFGSKEDILFSLISEMQKGVAIPLQIAGGQYRARANALGEDPKAALLALLGEFAKAVDSWRRHLLLAHQETRFLPVDRFRQILDNQRYMRDLLADLIELAVKPGVFSRQELLFRAHSLQMLTQSWATRRWAMEGIHDFETFRFLLERSVLAMLSDPKPDEPSEG